MQSLIDEKRDVGMRRINFCWSKNESSQTRLAGPEVLISIITFIIHTKTIASRKFGNANKMTKLPNVVTSAKVNK